MDIRLLGPVRATHDGLDIPLGSRRQKAIFAMLSLGAGRLVSTDDLIDGLWGEDVPTRPLNSIHVYVSGLRKAFDAVGLDRSLLQLRGAGYALSIARDQVDAFRFDALWREGRSALSQHPTLARAKLTDALAEWTGPTLADMRDFPFAERMIVHWNEIRVSAQEDLLEAQIACGELGVVIPELESLTEQYPTRERLWGQLMVALYRGNRQAEALAVYARARDRLADELGIDPGQALQQIELGILRHDPVLGEPEELLSRAAGSVDRLDNLDRSTDQPRPRDRLGVPAIPGELIGRRELLSELVDVVCSTSSGVLSLVGPGGLGKSRLAVAAAQQLLDAGRRVLFLSAMPGQTGAELVAGLAVALGGAEPQDDSLASSVRAAAMSLPGGDPILVLDNLHLLDDSPRDLVEALSRDAVDLTILVVTRLPLHLGSAAEFQVPPLEIPGPEATASDIAATGSGALFLDVARRANARFTIDRSNDRDVAALCRLLDGVPLALELAAAWMKVMGPRDAATRLLSGTSRPKRGDDAHGERTLTTTIQWTLDALTTGARRLVEAMAHCEFGMMLPDVESIADALVPHADALALLGELVEVGIVRLTDTRVEVRYVVLGPVRAQVRTSPVLQEAELDAVRASYLGALTGRFAIWSRDLDGPEGEVALGRFGDAEADLISLCEWGSGAGRRAEATAALVAATPLLVAAGRARTGLAMMRSVASDETTGTTSLLARARLAYSAGAYAEAEGLAELVLGQGVSEGTALAHALRGAARAATGSATEGADDAQAAVERAEAAGDYVALVIGLSVSAICAAIGGRFDQERDFYERRLAVVRAHRDRSRLADTLNILAEIALDEPDAAAAAAYGQEALVVAGTSRPNERRDALVTLARVDLVRGEVAAARERLRSATELAERIGQPLAIAQCGRVAACLAHACGAPAAEVHRLFALAAALEPGAADEPIEGDLRRVAEAAKSGLQAAETARIDAFAKAVGDADAMLAAIHALVPPD